MKAWLNLQAARIDALSLRERVFIFLSVIAVVMALADVFWIAPEQKAYDEMVQHSALQNEELQKLRNVVKLSSAPILAQSLHSDITQTQSQLAQVNQTLALQSSGAIDGATLNVVLSQLLKRFDGLTLVHTETVAPVSVAEGGAPQTLVASTRTPAGSSPVPLAHMTQAPVVVRHGVVLTVTGPYFTLMKYVQALESALPQVRWGSMQLKSGKTPATSELTLRMDMMEVSP